MKVKEVGYAYPTSDNAKKCGLEKEGCYTISTGESKEPLKCIAGFKSLKIAMDTADLMPEPYETFGGIPANGTSFVKNAVEEGSF